MALPSNKTKIVATIGPASESEALLQRLIRAGLSVARLNFSHGDLTSHAERIQRIRSAAEAVGRRVAIMADLPGPKMRIGDIETEPIQLQAGEKFTLTTELIMGNLQRVSVSFKDLPNVVKRGDRLFLNDGLVELTVTQVSGGDVQCEVSVGGELRSRKGLILPGIALGTCAFTEHDRTCLEFALRHGVDAVSQSFVETGDDIQAVRAAAQAAGKRPFIVAKVERLNAIRRFDDILDASDGIMVARGDLGVEVPIEEMAVLQKRLIARAHVAGKPVITATQMLESMVASRLPTRAEATDVANAILDGTDAVMLSGESAIGKYPEESVAMLAKIAAYTESQRRPVGLAELRSRLAHVRSPLPDARGFVQSDEGTKLRQPITRADAMTSVVEAALDSAPCAVAFVPTRTGTMARMISRLNPLQWIVAVCRNPAVCQELMFSGGVEPVQLVDDPRSWRDFARTWMKEHHLPGSVALLLAGPSIGNPDANYRLEFLNVGEHPTDISEASLLIEADAVGR
jgi:pyruvate kinase